MQQLFFVLVAALIWVHSLEAQSDIFLVRHAEKAQGGDAKDPDLSEAGRARAEALAKMLKEAGITAIYATEFKRTQQTAEPLARLLHLEVTVNPAKETAALISKLKETKGNALVVGHSNTLPEIIKTLGVSDSIAIDEGDYDNLLILSLGTGPALLLRLHFD